MAAQQSIVDGTPDDINIATELLTRPRILPRQTSFSGTSIGQQSLNDLQLPDRFNGSTGTGISRRAIQSSNTWTSSSGEILLEHDDIEDRSLFVEEYNRLAKKHGVRIMVTEDFDECADNPNSSTKPPGWFSRNIFRRTSSTTSVRYEKGLKHRRSISDISLRLKSRKDKLKDKDLQELVRLCGASILYLPAEYGSGSLTVPTCFRATAQYLVQHGPAARGIFRIPGAHNVVEALYNHFCSVDENGAVIAGTVRCPTLPDHIRCDVHDVASAFKRFLVGLPGGVLGSLPLFDALVAIQGQLHGDAEFTRTKQSKVRARLIALAISTLQSHYRRELICAVFGLLSIIGRAAETAPREDDRGRPLPTTDLMGYSALGIVFGPLLIGDYLDNYSMHLANPTGGLVVLPVSPPKSRKERKKKQRPYTEEPISFISQVDKIKVANSITEMLITHWREVARHMRSIASLKTPESPQALETARPYLRPSVSEGFSLRKPPDWDQIKPVSVGRHDNTGSPTPEGRVTTEDEAKIVVSSPQKEDLIVKKQRSRSKMRPKSGQPLSGSRSINLQLSPTAEETTSEESAATTVTTTSNHNYTRQYKGTATLIPKAMSNEVRDRPGTPSPRKRSLTDFKKQKKIPPDMEERKGLPIETRTHHNTAKVPSTYHGKHSLSMFASSNPVNNAPPSKITYPSMKSPVVSVHTPEQLSSTTPRRTVKSEPGKFNKSTSLLMRRSVKSALPKSTPPISPIRAGCFTSRDPVPSISLEADMEMVTEMGKALKATADAGASEAQTEEHQEVHQTPAPQTTVEGNQKPDFQPPVLIFDTEPLLKHSATLKPPIAMNETSEDSVSCVSHKDDVESIVALSRIIESDNTTPTKGTRPATLRKAVVGSSEKNVSEESMRKKKKKSSSADVPVIAKPSSSFLPRLTNFIRGSDKSPSLPSSPVKGSPADLAKPSHAPIVAHKSDVTGACEAQNIERLVKKTLMPSGGSVRALAEKFNNPSPAKARDASSPPRAGHRKAISVDTLAATSPNRRESLIAPYTTNSSPCKSQMSGGSERTPQSNRNSVAAALAVSGPNSPTRDKRRSPVKPSPPRRLLIPTVEDSKSLRAMRNSYEAGDDSLDMFAVNSSNPYSNVLRQADPAPVTIKSLDDHRSNPSRGPSLGTVLPAPEPPPVAQHVHFLRPLSGLGDRADFVHPDSQFRDIFRGSPPVSPCASPSLLRCPGTPPITRGNSVLHTQIRSLQKSIEKKDHEIAKLRQQLITKGSLDIGPLSEQLRESKRETQMWKMRAEVAEKQVEMFSLLPLGRVNSTRLSSEAAIEMYRASTGHFDDVLQPRQRSNGGRGLDGAERAWTSDGSGSTVIHEVTEIGNAAQQEAVDTWISQAMDRLDNDSS